MELAKQAQKFVVDNYSKKGIECSQIGDGFLFLQLPPRLQDIQDIAQELEEKFGASIDAELDQNNGVSVHCLFVFTITKLTMHRV